MIRLIGRSTVAPSLQPQPIKSPSHQALPAPSAKVQRKRGPLHQITSDRRTPAWMGVTRCTI